MVYNKGYSKEYKQKTFFFFLDAETMTFRVFYFNLFCFFFLDSRSESSMLTALPISSNMIDPNYFKQNLNWPKRSGSTMHSIFAPHIIQVKFHWSEYRQWDLVSTQESIYLLKQGSL